MIRFSVEDVSLTRDGESHDFESIVDHSYLLFYAADVSLTSHLPVAAVKAEVDPSASGNLQFKMPLMLKPNTDYQLLAIANADEYTPSGFENFGEYLESWCNAPDYADKNPIHLYCSSRISPSSKTGLPMSGGMTGGSKFRFAVENGAYIVSASLSFRRIVARIDVANIIKEGFKVEGVALCNWRDAVPAIAYDGQIGNKFGLVQGVLSNEGESLSKMFFVDMPDPNETGIQQLNKKIYCFPSVSYDSYLGDRESTALIIKAKYGEDSESTYYRVNVGVRANQSKIDSNTKYLVTIQSVKGRGATTPEEAYASKESPIVLSVVEDWDLEAPNFAMDDKGNFIIVSKGGTMEFDGDASENVEIKVLVSKGLVWTAEYVANDEESESAFNVVKLSDSALSIGPKGANEKDTPLSGCCRVYASTSDGKMLEVNIPLLQKMAEEKPYEPVEPANLPFAIIPVSGDRVKIDHDARTIEIDGFDPDCFNSFIDIPFRVYVNESESDISSINISSTLEWPLEGRISTDESNGYTYCQETFATKTLGQVYSPYGALTSINKISSPLKLRDKDEFYISIGSMGPDDPGIIDRKIELTANGESVSYALTIKPCPAIIDDVVLIDNSGIAWIIQDRNIQNPTNMLYACEDGKKTQAYNYSFITNIKIKIPFKFSDKNVSMDEEFHSSYIGNFYSYKNRNTLESNEMQEGDRITWLKKLTEDFIVKTSPFYESNNYEDWILPDESVLEIMRSKIKVSKLRMYFVSDVPVKSGKKFIPICCYLPYLCFSIGDYSELTNGYYMSDDGNTPKSIKIFYFDRNGVMCNLPSYINNNLGYVRLVRRLNYEEIESYKQNYLGYGSQAHKLILCHPDTYTSEGWIAK